MDERALIASARRGDAESFNQLVRRHQDVAYDVAYRLLGHPDAAADATQEAVLGAYRALPALRGGSFRAWLLRRVVGACRRRARLRHSRLSAWAGDELQGADCSSQRDSPESSEEAPLDPGLVQATQAGIARLPLESQVVLVLADVQGLSYEEVAQVTGAAPAVVGRQLGRARARLRDWLHPNGSRPGAR